MRPERSDRAEPRDGVRSQPLCERVADLQRASALLGEALHDTLGARGVMVRLEARHLCPETTGSVLTQAYLGDFRRPLWRDRLESMPVGGSGGG